MLENFQNKYRIPSARFQNWDYRSNAQYFITICTAHRECFFGAIRNGEMILTELGEIVVDEWIKTPSVRPDMNIILDVFALMPNHFHGIIFIGKNEYNNRLMNNDNNHDAGRDTMPGVSMKPTPHGIRDARHGDSTKQTRQYIQPHHNISSSIDLPTFPTIQTKTNITETNSKNQFGPQVKNLSSIIRGFKSAVTINARKIDPDFAWQPRFHDCIIRDDRSYQRIKNYIIDNPKKWEKDDFLG